jgi:hypothetical protein
MLRYQEARTHAFIAACLMWAGALVLLAAPGDRYPTGDLKGADFVQLYTLAQVAFEGEYPRVEDLERLHARQVELVPASATERYLPVYPPQAALLFAPFRYLSYRAAVCVWVLILISGYAAIVWSTWRSVRDVFPDGWFVAAAAAAFPPFWLLVLFGQTTLVPLAGFFLAWRALKANRPFVAGLAFGLLSIKPQFGILLAFVVVVNAQWRILLGGVCSIVIQVAAVIGTLGFQALRAYFDTVLAMRRIEELLEPDAWRMHSLRTITNLAPGNPGQALWFVICAAVVAIVVWIWRTNAKLDTRMGMLVLGTVLINPHLFVYDASVLVLALLWLGTLVEAERPSWRAAYWHAVYFLFMFFLFPTARLLFLQFSVLVMLWLFWRVAQGIREIETARVSIERVPVGA